MFAKLFALFFGKKKEPEPTVTITQRMEQREAKRYPRDLYDNAQPMRTGKARSSSSVTSSTRRDDGIMSDPIHPLNPLNPIGFNSAIYQDSTPSHSSSNYDCGSSSSSSYDSGSSSCDSGSSSSGGGD